jgi:S1-C subfamily serine protease
VLRGDSNFRRLLEGDLSAAPDLNLTQGTVQSFQSGEGGMPLVVHTASIAKGNSGGPLVDGCGRVIGVNTFISVDQDQSSKINYAIRSQVMAGFLQSAGASARTDTRPCAAGK